MTNATPDLTRPIVNGWVSPIHMRAPRSVGTVRLLADGNPMHMIACTVPPRFDRMPPDGTATCEYGVHELICTHGHLAAVYWKASGMSIMCEGCASLGYLDISGPHCPCLQHYRSVARWRRETSPRYREWRDAVSEGTR